MSKESKGEVQQITVEYLRKRINKYDQQIEGLRVAAEQVRGKRDEAQDQLNYMQGIVEKEPDTK